MKVTRVFGGAGIHFHSFAHPPLLPPYTLGDIEVMQVTKMDDEIPDCGWQDVYALYGCPLSYDD
jgi:hypothetical protein